MNISIPKLLLISVSYYFVSILLYALTAGGWSIFFTPLMYSLFFYGPLGLGILAVIGLWKFRGQNRGVIPKGVWLTLIALQLGTILLNVNDCGDSGAAAFVFVERLFGSACDNSLRYLSGQEVWRIFQGIIFVTYMATSYAILFILARENTVENPQIKHKTFFQKSISWILKILIVCVSIPPLIFVANLIEGMP